MRYFKIVLVLHFNDLIVYHLYSWKIKLHSCSVSIISSYTGILRLSVFHINYTKESKIAKIEKSNNVMCYQLVSCYIPFCFL